MTVLRESLALYLAPGGPLSEILEAKRQQSRFPVKPEDIERLIRAVAEF